ncbi:MAG: hypothetical protein ABEJ57_03025 [Halobacteriaceae archaeon]
MDSDDGQSPVAAAALARWLRLLRLLFTVVLLAIGVWRALAGL